MRKLPAFGLIVSVLAANAACGGGDGGTAPTIEVSVTPDRDTLTVGTSTQLSASVTGSSNTQVTWSVVGGTAAGSVTANGLYTAGSAPGTILVIAASQEAPTSTDTARILVVAAPGGTLAVPDSAARGATVPAAIAPTAGTTYEWSATGGTIAAGQGTPNVSLTAGTGGTMEVQCTVRNLADSSLTVSGQTILVAPPTITSFVAAHDTVVSGLGTTITATFSGGTAAVDQSVGAVTSGVPVPVGPFATGYTGTLLTLTVTGFRGSTVTAQRRIVSVNAPVLGFFRLVGSKAPIGGRGQFFLNWNHDPDVVVTITPDGGQVITETPLTPVLTVAGKTTYTVRVQAPGVDSAIVDTASIEVVAPPPGQFTAANTMKRSRAGMSVTRLSNGKVLIAGGISSVLVSSSAEVYDPAAGTFTLTDSMAVHRWNHMAELLSDGRVFVAGGAADPLDQAVTELYNPATGTWSPGPTLQTRPLLSARLTDQRVLLVPSSGAAEIFDPVAMNTTLTGVVPAGLQEFRVVSLSGNRALITSTGNFGAPDSSAWVFDAGSGQFSSTGTMHLQHYSGSVTALADGRVLMVGGISYTANSVSHTAKAEIFNPSTGLWTITGSLAIPRHVPHLTLLADGKVLLTGGLDELNQIPRYSEIFDPSTGQFTPLLVNIPDELYASAGVLLNNGNALLLGDDGVHDAGGMTEIFQP